MIRPLLRVPPALAQGALRGGLTTRIGFPAAAEAEPARSREILAAALGIDPSRMAWAKQIHGPVARLVESPGAQGEADALIDPQGRHLLLISVADCCPVLIWQSRGRALAVAHAGWRGLVAGVLQQTVSALAGHGVDPESLRAWIGPRIGVENFEVGPEVAARFDPRFVRDDRPRPHVDLGAAAVAALVAAGMTEAAVALCPDDCYARSELYWSYRRDGGIAGRQLGFLLRD